MTKAGFTEIGDRCFVARYPEWDVNVGLVVGDAGVLLVDTRASRSQGLAMRDAVGRLALGAEIRWVVNTHQHFDHTLGNIAFDGATIHAHENAAAGLAASTERVKQRIRDDPTPDPAHPELTEQVLADVLETEMRRPDVTFSSVSTIDLGDRFVELLHPGRGHTDGDVVVTVPDARVVFAGDLVEESAPPAYGVDSWPLHWPASLDLMVGVLTPDSVVVPGHGAVVDRQFVQDQRVDVATVAEAIRELAANGVPVTEALTVGAQRGVWPFPVERLRHAVERGYAQLPRSARSLPLA